MVALLALISAGTPSTRTSCRPPKSLTVSFLRPPPLTPYCSDEITELGSCSAPIPEKVAVRRGYCGCEPRDQLKLYVEVLVIIVIIETDQETRRKDPGKM